MDIKLHWELLRLVGFVPYERGTTLYFIKVATTRESSVTGDHSYRGCTQALCLLPTPCPLGKSSGALPTQNKCLHVEWPILMCDFHAFVLTVTHPAPICVTM